ncbi:MAG: PEP-CTERM sorting domain-containing protein [Opitutales bacterium]
MKRPLLLPAFLACLLAGGLSAQTLASWDVNGVDVDDGIGIDGGSTSSPFTFSAGTTASNVGSATLTLSSSVNPSTSSDQYGFKVSGGNDGFTLSDAISSGHYMEISISASSGFLLNLTELDFIGESSGTGADSGAILTSVDGFNDSSAIATVSGVSGDTGGFDTDGSGFGTISLSGSQYQGISSISFRVYGWDATSGAGVTNFRDLSNDDITISGTVSVNPIPEPGTYGLIAGLAGLGLLIYRRRRG